MPLDLARIGGFCFDIDGTLSDTDDALTQRIAAKLAPIQRLFPRANTDKTARRIVMMIESPGTFLISLPDRLGLSSHFIKVVDYYARKGYGPAKNSDWLIPDVPAMLARLSEKYPLAIVTARSESRTLDFLDQHQLTPYFKAVASALTVRHTKPFPDPVLWASRQMGIQAAECVMVGDTTVDIISGKAAGAQAVGVLCGYGMENELLHSGADLILANTPMMADTVLGPLLPQPDAGQAGPDAPAG